jgi:hypothetical protein
MKKYSHPISDKSNSSHPSLSPSCYEICQFSFVAVLVDICILCGFFCQVVFYRSLGASLPVDASLADTLLQTCLCATLL